MDNFSESEKNRLLIIQTIQRMYSEGVKIRKIAKILKMNRNTVKKYLEGNPENLCRFNTSSKISLFREKIIQLLKEGYTQTDVVRKIKEYGYDAKDSNARMYIQKVIKVEKLEVNKYSSEVTCASSWKKSRTEYIKRRGIFNYLWMNGELTNAHKQHLYAQYPVLIELEKCIREFRKIFQTSNMPYLYLFIDTYKKSTIKDISSFANGLLNDIEAVENAVASPLSNGYVEGTNNKIKMKKRVMYGRCGIELLSAKLMLKPTW